MKLKVHYISNNVLNREALTTDLTGLILNIVTSWRNGNADCHIVLGVLPFLASREHL